jgi:hypothetical protein
MINTAGIDDLSKGKLHYYNKEKVSNDKSIMIRTLNTK